jgi:hypothetical protein
MGRVDERGNDGRRWYQLVRQLQSLRHHLHVQLGHARDVATRSAQAGDEADLHRIAGGGEDNGNRRNRRKIRFVESRKIAKKEAKIANAWPLVPAACPLSGRAGPRRLPWDIRINHELVPMSVTYLWGGAFEARMRRPHEPILGQPLRGMARLFSTIREEQPRDA